MSEAINPRDELVELNRLFAAMPPVQAMDIKAMKLEDEVLQVSAPLDKNVNDKDCAFGGSLVSVMTMAAWGLLTELARREPLAADIYIADSQVRFMAPVFGDLQASAGLHAETRWELLRQAFLSKGKARAMVEAHIKNEQGQTLCQMSARFALISRKVR
jgi:thioesterase domain-containing protein